MYKFVAIDIDGTLLNSVGELTHHTTETIRKATAKGVKVVLTSRKSYRLCQRNSKSIAC